LINEIEILKYLGHPGHPGILKLYEVHETMLSIFLVMELIEGGELFTRLKEKKNYSEKDCSIMLRRIIEPLLYIQTKGIIHRDLKPENLILRSKEQEYDIVIADFGLAQVVERKPFLHVRCGTPGYCAPEILNYQNGSPLYDSNCDVFSLGCIFYHIIVGKNPFGAKYQKETLHLNKECAVWYDHPKIKAMSLSAQDLLKRLLEKDPTRRPSLEECLDHEFFIESNRRMSVISFSFARYTLTPQNSRDRSRDHRTSHEHLEEGLSFQFGNVNLMRGVVDTVNELSMSAGNEMQRYEIPGVERSQISRSTFMRQAKKEETAILLSPYKQPSSRLQGLGKKGYFDDGDSVHSSSHSEDLGTFNSEENEKENFNRRIAFMGKVKNLMNNGLMANPFKDFDKIDEDISIKTKVHSLFLNPNEQTLNKVPRITKST